jgi:hypothetical protein
MPLSTVGSMDNVLRDAIRYKLVAPLPNDLFQIEARLHFRLHCHDTGNSLTVWVIDPATGERFELVRATFWYSASYLFNEERWENGHALVALRRHVERLRSEIAAHESALTATAIAEDQNLQKELGKKRDRFHSLFAEAQP